MSVSLYAKTFGARLINSVGGILCVLIVVSKYLPEQAGAIYALLSLVGFAALFESGMPMLVLNRASALVRGEAWATSMPQMQAEHVAPLFGHYFSITLCLSLLLLLLYLPAGYIFSPAIHQAEAWIWVTCCAALALSMPLSLLLNFMEGLGFLDDVARVRTWQALFLQGGLVGGLLLGWGGAAVALQLSLSMLAALASLMQLGASRRLFLRALFRSLRQLKSSWFSPSQLYNDWSLQWRLMLTTVSTFFSNQAWVLGISLTGNLALTGRVAITMQVITALIGFSITPLASRLAQLSTLAHAAQKLHYQSLRGILISHVVKTFLIIGGGAVLGFWVISYVIPAVPGRIMALGPSMMMVASVPMMLATSTSTLLNQSLGRDDMYLLSILRIAIPPAVFFLFGHAIGEWHVSMAYFFASFVAMIIAFVIQGAAFRRVFS